MDTRLDRMRTQSTDHAADHPLMNPSLRALVDTSLQGKLIHRAFRPLHANAAFAAMYGFDSVEQVLQRPSIADLLDSGCANDPVGAWVRLMENPGEPSRQRHQRKDGQRFTAKVFSRPIPWDKLGPAVAMAVFDLSEEEALFEQLRQARHEAETLGRSRQRLIHAAAHSLRGPLHGITGRLQLLVQDNPFEAGSEHLDAALAACDTLLRTIEDVLDAAALETDTLVIKHQPFDLRAIAQTAVSALQAEHGRALVDLVISPHVANRYSGDDRRVQRVLIALLDEALRRSTQGVLTLSLAPFRDGVALRVETGVVGAQARFPTEIQDIVDPMSLARGLVTALSGSLVEDLDGGSLVIAAYLPLQAVTAPSPGKTASRDILVVEDHAGNRRLLELILTSLGHRVTLASNGFLAVAEVRRRPFDLVLMDVSMPGIDGLEACRRMRALDLPWAGLPIVALTAHVTAEVQVATQKAGMDGFLSKPIDLSRLAVTVAEATQQAAP